MHPNQIAPIYKYEMRWAKRLKQEVSCDNTGCHHREWCQRIMSKGYAKHFRAALSSLQSKFKITPTAVNCSWYFPQKKNSNWVPQAPMVQKMACKNRQLRRQFALEMLSGIEKDET
jgi:hypothetical protein